MEKITKRDNFNAIIELAQANNRNDLVEFAKHEIAKMDERNEKRSSQPSKTAIANEPIKASIVAFVKEHKEAVASDIAVACEISTQKASSLCRQLVDDGVLTSTEVKVPKKGKVKGYSVIKAE